MKRLLIMPILALGFALLAPAAYANHGGAQTPDAESEDTHCRTFFAGGHGDCSVTHPTGANAQMGTQVSGVPTADGWHVVFTARIIDNDTDTILTARSFDQTVPYTFDQSVPDVGDVPVPNRPTFGVTTGGGGETTSASCTTDVAVGTGGQIACTYDPANMTIPWL